MGSKWILRVNFIVMTLGKSETAKKISKSKKSARAENQQEQEEQQVQVGKI